MIVEGVLGKRRSNMEEKALIGDVVLPLDQADRDLLHAVACGDEKGLETLYEKYGQRLYAYACRLCGDAALAEDVLQETLVIIWQSARNYRGQGRVIAWMLGIVHHQAMKSLRHPVRALTEAVEESLPSHLPLPEDQFQDAEQQKWLKHGLDKLSLEHRAVLELIFYQKLSYTEAAAVCHCPVGTVKSRLNQARKQLKGTLIRMEEGQEVIYEKSSEI